MGEWGLFALGVIAVFCAALRCLHSISCHLHQENELDPTCAFLVLPSELRTQHCLGTPFLADHHQAVPGPHCAAAWAWWAVLPLQPAWRSVGLSWATFNPFPLLCHSNGLVSACAITISHSCCFCLPTLCPLCQVLHKQQRSSGQTQREWQQWNLPTASLLPALQHSSR